MTESLLNDDRITAIGLLMEVCTGLSARLAPQLEEHGLSFSSFEVLLRLARSPKHQLRMSDLAAQTSLSTSGITRMVDRMEREGLVCRRACPTDRRSSHTVLTETGMRRLDAVLPRHLELIERWFTGQLGPAALYGLLAALRTVRDNVHPGAVAGAPTPDSDAPDPGPCG